MRLLLTVFFLGFTREVFSQECPDYDYCAGFLKHKCKNGATCSYAPNNCMICLCAPGFTGLHCKAAITTITVAGSIIQQIHTNHTTILPPPKLTTTVPAVKVDRGLTTYLPDGKCGSKNVCLNSTMCLGNGRMDCAKGWGVISTGCCSKCRLDCGIGNCTTQRKNRDVYSICICPLNYYSLNSTQPCVHRCEIFPKDKRCIKAPKPKDYTPIIAGAVIGSVIFLLAIFGITLWFFYKKRMTWALKFVYYMSSYEDNDDLEHDAFISYKSNGIGDSFVTQNLYKKLEDEFGYSCVFHARNFVPGKMIIDNILEAINNCRRVILVLTKDYLSSEWCHLEVSVAQQRMMERKTRILPIMLDDITGDLEEYPNLKFILKHVTYLEVPESDKGKEEFWERLRYAMPKTKEADERTDVCGCLSKIAKLFQCPCKTATDNTEAPGEMNRMKGSNSIMNEAFVSEEQEYETGEVCSAKTNTRSHGSSSGKVGTDLQRVRNCVVSQELVASKDNAPGPSKGEMLTFTEYQI